MSTAPNCPQCGQPGVRTVKVASTAGADSHSTMLWVCENDHRFGDIR